MANGWLEDAEATQLAGSQDRIRITYMIVDNIGSGEMANVAGEEGRRVSGHGGRVV